MRKYLIAILLVVFIVAGAFYAYFSRSVFIDFRPNAPVSVAFRAGEDAIMQQDADGRYVPIQLRGVEMTPSRPGHMAWDFGITTYDYYRWFGYIDEMGANTLYVPHIMDSNFYYALYRFNTGNARPLLLLQGIYGHDYNSLTSRLKEAIDIIHGRRINFFDRTGIEAFLSDVSPWVVGFIVGADWDPDTIVFMNHFDPAMPDSFQGEFFSAAEGASRFEVMLAQVMDSAAAYESRRFKVQRPIGFISSPIVDFLEYAPAYAAQLRKYVQLNPEHIIPSERMVAGTFAAYRLFFFTDDFTRYLTPSQTEALAPILADLDRSCIYNGYLDLLARYHSMPVIAAGFGFSSSRAPYIVDRPPLTEREQGEALVEMVTQLEESGWAGSIISTWQDTWERRTWNTAFSSDPWHYHYWHNLQAVDQWYGLMAFDPGRYTRPVLIDGQANEWDESHLIHEYDGMRIYAQYSLQGLYLLVRGEGVNPQNTLYLPLDVTPRSGTSAFYGLEFERPADFLLILSGEDESRLLVNRRYHATHQRFYEEMMGINPFTHNIPPRWDSEFVPITLALQNPVIIEAELFYRLADEAREMRRLRSWDTGILTHGMGDPASPHFNSLADFFFGENLVEIRLPWMMLNFYDPSYMRVHDDYYDRFGVEGIRIQEIYIGIAAENGEVPMSLIPLRGWRNTVHTHERLKQSYFIMQEFWSN
ncbi:MAG: hypothetical protein FWC96_02250 [Oscillospiraceae bacterium]|nr:hypothetical protein [Oscillospiraceae bacterium]